MLAKGKKKTADSLNYFLSCKDITNLNKPNKKYMIRVSQWLTKIVSSLKEKVNYRRRVLKKSQLTIVQRKGLWTVIFLVTLGIVIGTAYTFLAEELSKSKLVVVLNIAQAKDDGVSRELDQRNKASQDEITPHKVDGDLVSLVKNCDWDWKVALAIAKTESGLNSKAHNDNRNGTIDTGYFQINSIHGFSKEWLEVPENNVTAACAIYHQAHNSFNPWVTFSKGYYLGNI